MREVGEIVSRVFYFLPTWAARRQLFVWPPLLTLLLGLHRKCLVGFSCCEINCLGFSLSWQGFIASVYSKLHVALQAGWKVTREVIIWLQVSHIRSGRGGVGGAIAMVVLLCAGPVGPVLGRSTPWKSHSPSYLWERKVGSSLQQEFYGVLRNLRCVHSFVH